MNLRPEIAAQPPRGDTSPAPLAAQPPVSEEMNLAMAGQSSDPLATTDNGDNSLGDRRSVLLSAYPSNAQAYLAEDSSVYDHARPFPADPAAGQPEPGPSTMENMAGVWRIVPGRSATTRYLAGQDLAVAVLAMLALKAEK